MKIRNGFVSNSSSSSFICEICGAVESGMDISLRECKMVQCKNGHVFHEACLDEESKNILTELSEDENTEYPYEMDISFCPVCQLRVLTNDDASFYLEKVLGMTYEQVLNDIKAKFGTWEAFNEKMHEKPVKPE